MPKTVVEIVFEFIKPYAESLGIELVEVEYAKKQNGMNLTLFIDKDGGVTLDDCERLHRLVDEPLDDLDPISESYTLNVSSLGLDRPLKTDRDFQKNIDKEIIVKLYSSVNGRKRFEGFLLSFDENNFTLRENKDILVFSRKAVAHVEPLIRF